MNSPGESIVDVKPGKVYMTASSLSVAIVMTSEGAWYEVDRT